ncbi:hypothetical protein APA_5248 [Pseudanabaena sp. lw0831]|uniref:hypothetical protein n=1 Tax=Pseudanabaena sp. lw0831 TaxID=1357935 RepID=UPI0019157891|nr:hypothetical protein [Pseudanabaena sp. lw0831]GBO52158.1 hypothetical protein APA_5248 [Pseudanabaena sp. lw0831]
MDYLLQSDRLSIELSKKFALGEIASIMLVVTEDIQSIFTGLKDDLVASLQFLLGYPLKECDRTDLRFWYVGAGQNVAQAKNNCPIAVGF